MMTVTQETLKAIPDPVARIVADDLVRRGIILLAEDTHDNREWGPPHVRSCDARDNAAGYRNTIPH